MNKIIKYKVDDILLVDFKNNQIIGNHKANQMEKTNSMFLFTLSMIKISLIPPPTKPPAKYKYPDCVKMSMNRYKALKSTIKSKIIAMVGFTRSFIGLV